MRGIKHVDKNELTPASQAFLNATVTIKASGKQGKVEAVLPDKNGDPWSLHVRIEGESAPEVVSPDEVERQVTVN